MEPLDYFDGILRFLGHDAAAIEFGEGRQLLLVRFLPRGVRFEATHVYEARILLQDGLGLRDGDHVRIDGHLTAGPVQALHLINVFRVDAEGHALRLT